MSSPDVRMPRVVTLWLPVVFCHRCRLQVLVTDATGKWTMPTFLTPMLSDARCLVCLWCARLDPDPSRMVPIAPVMAGYLTGCADPLSDRAAFDLLLSLGASLDPGDDDPWRRGDAGLY